MTYEEFDSNLKCSLFALKFCKLYSISINLGSTIIIMNLINFCFFISLVKVLKEEEEEKPDETDYFAGN